MIPKLLRLQKTYNEWRVTARDGSGELDGAITMVFDANTLALKEWIIADNFGGETRVLLSDLKYNERINPRVSLFCGMTLAATDAVKNAQLQFLYKTSCIFD